MLSTPAQAMCPCRAPVPCHFFRGLPIIRQAQVGLHLRQAISHLAQSCGILYNGSSLPQSDLCGVDPSYTVWLSGRRIGLARGFLVFFISFARCDIATWVHTRSSKVAFNSYVISFAMNSCGVMESHQRPFQSFDISFKLQTRASLH